MKISRFKQIDQKTLNYVQIKRFLYVLKFQKRINKIENLKIFKLLKNLQQEISFSNKFKRSEEKIYQKNVAKEQIQKVMKKIKQFLNKEKELILFLQYLQEMFKYMYIRIQRLILKKRIQIEQVQQRKKRSFNTNKLIQGQSFGEMALLNDSLRSASIICDTKCIFGVLSKKDYKEILQKAQENKMNQQLKEFHACMEYHNLSTKLLDILFFAFQSFHYQFRQGVYYQGQQSKQEIYLIKNGEFIITENNDDYYNPKRCVKYIALLQKGQFFGDHECFLNLEKRQQNVICNSENGIVLKIQLSNLIQRLQSTNQMHLYDQLKNACLQREQIRLERKSRQITLNENYFIDMKYVKQRNLSYQVKSVRSARRNTFSIRSPLQMAQDVIKNKKQTLNLIKINKHFKIKHLIIKKIDLGIIFNK
ncbi:unnamed protein product [Paramecium sonneborni]|uniref:Cyclic nucleotide-binding domain-containing protein n=1 Tax=Paramecium sonneborni TaxID=65129 RepID=A0A8S1Q2Z2_9CILI|nr:unnamed protein product [Paramecium sonneborni]